MSSKLSDVVMMGAPAPGRFIGRLDALARLRGAFEAGRRVVTVLGTGGIGKTRLVHEFAAIAPLAGPVWLADLAEAHTVDDLCFAVASALQMPGPTSRPVQRLASALAARGEALLVLDNFEQLEPEALEGVRTWLATARALRVLITSRRVLTFPDASAETLELGPLGLPDEADDTGVATSEAVQLFVDRARTHDHGFAVDALELRTVARLVRQLDGIPLAIELAASRVDVLGVDGLLARVPKALDVLSRRRGGREARHATLRRAIEWSWQLLDPHAQRALAQCGVFRGGFGIDAAEGVLNLGRGAADTAVLDALQTLREHSLLRSRHAQGDGVRFAMFDTVRDFAVDQLARGTTTAAVEKRYVAYYAALAQRLAPATDLGDTAALRRAVLERENLAAALDLMLRAAARTRADQERVLQLAVALEAVLSQQGPPAPRLAVLDRALRAAPSASIDPATRARAFRARGRARYAAGDLDDAERDLETALAITHPLATLRGSVLLDLGVVHHTRRAIERARACYTEALTIHRVHGPRLAEGRTLGNLGALHHDVGAFDPARAHYAQALGIFHDAGDLRLEGIFLTNLGILDAETGRTDEARARYERALRILTLAEDARLTGIAEGNFAVLLHECGRLDEACVRHERALRALRSVGDVRSEGQCLARLGATLAELGRLDEARAILDESAFRIESSGDALLHQLLQLARGLLAVVPDTGGRSVGLRDLRKEIALAQRRGSEGQPSSADLSDDVRAMLRIVERVLNRVDPVHDAVATLPDDVLAIGPDTTWFRAPNGTWQDLRRHASLRSLLAALVGQHAVRGAFLTLDALREVAWPGQKIRPDAAAHRVYVALSTLRARGLSDWLQRESDGYRLDPALAVHVVDAVPTVRPGSSG